MAIQVYGTTWCGITLGVRKYFMNARLTHEFRDIDRDPDANAFVLTVADGQRRFPIVLRDEEIIRHPTVACLQHIVETHALHCE